MKTLSLLKKALFCIGLFYGFVSYGQPNLSNTVTVPTPGSYVPGEIIVILEAGLTDLEKQAVRTYYQVISYTAYSNRLERWEVPFPLIINDGVTTTILLNEYELLEYIDNNNGGNSDDNGSNAGGTEGSGIADPRARVDGADYNYVYTEPLNLGNATPLPNDPLTACPGNPHLYGNTGPFINNLPTVVIMDQVMTMRTPHVQEFFTPEYTMPAGVASHADQVDYVSNFVNTANGLPVQVINLVIFDEFGQATYADFIEALFWLYENGYQHLIINMSGSARVTTIGDNSQFLLSRINALLTQMGSVLVTSAGNDGVDIGEGNVLPGGAIMDREITVAGTSNCFSQAWLGSNQNNLQFEIAAEAEDILVPFTTSSWVEADGTSFAAPQVTSTLVQIASHLPTATTMDLQERLLLAASNVTALEGYSQDGRVLNATAATTFLNGMGLTAQPGTNPEDWDGTASTFTGSDLAPGLFAEIAPNPTHDIFTLHYNSTATSPVILEVYNDLGQRLSQQTLSNGEQSIQLSMQRLGAEKAGLYLLRIRQEDQVATRRIIVR